MPGPFGWEMCLGRWGRGEEIVEALKAGVGGRRDGRVRCRGQVEALGRMGQVDGGKDRGQEIEAEVGPLGPRRGWKGRGRCKRHWEARATWACD